MASVLLERETVDGEACQALLDNRWSEYLLKEQNGETPAAKASAEVEAANAAANANADVTAPADASAAPPANDAPTGGAPLR